MTSRTLSANLINICIVPKRVGYPKPSTGTVWAKAHDCVDALHSLVRSVDLSCSEAEENPDISVSRIGHLRAALCERTLVQLANFTLSEAAERAFNESIGSLERLSYRDPHQVQMFQMLTQALNDLREGVEATKRLVRERCKIRDRVFV